MLISTAFASCTHESEDLNSLPGKNLDIHVGIQETATSRAVITGQNLIDGSLVGVTVVDATGTAYQDQDYNNVCYTAATVDGKQQWTPDKDVTLSGEPATLYAYYPWTDGVDVSAIPVDMAEADQTDWMYATPVEGLNDANSTAQVKLHHALANVKLTLYKDSYSGAGEVTAFSVQSDGAATGGTLNAKTGTFTATVNDGQAITRTLAYTLTDKASATPFDCMVVPTGTNAAMTVTVTVDGHTYSSTTDAFTLAKATAYNLALKLTSTGLSVTSVSLTDWSEEPLPDTDFEPVISGPVVNSAGKANGVYAVTATGELIAYNDAAVDATCLGVALITDNQRIMIEKMGEANTEWNSNTTIYWSKNLNGKNVAGITETIDQTVAKADFSGKEHTNAIIAAYTEHSVAMDARDMCSVLQTFNDGDNNGGYSDWYIPACGQLYEIYTNKTKINEALTAMSSTAFSGYYWSSSEYSSASGWYVYFTNGDVYNFGKSGSRGSVRFVRDI